MNFNKLLIIPDSENLSAYIELAGKYGCGFEYNDFFLPDVLDDSEKCDKIIAEYCVGNIPQYCTMHGAFLDVTVFSDDRKIKAVSDERVEQSLLLAEKIGAKAVVFHTNYMPNFLQDTYRENWVERNRLYWKEKLNNHPEINIYLENMFDTDPELLASLAEKMQCESRFGICFDYAHAHVFGNQGEIEKWAVKLGKYVKHVHINDNNFISDLHLAVGDGFINWELFKELYSKYFPKASVLVEVRGEEKIRKSLEFLSEL
ncbi:MAG: TIM barrel protein [Lachnospiraceae bacterium]|nr:TIM barrel protein [Lachnospiraceae bacterium]